jgi:hypothetical protein
MVGHDRENDSEIKVFIETPGEINVAFMGERGARGIRDVASRLLCGAPSGENGIVRNKPSTRKSGGAVSGAGPCALRAEALHTRARNSPMRQGRNMRMGFRDNTEFPREKKTEHMHRNARAVMRLEERSDTKLKRSRQIKYPGWTVEA